ncbi:hemerythrin domain-containing protein [Phytohabitans aurantiacus]|jgi:hypothetical protein|uniref:Hemerythrin-like domain-containing protein n=1 Tax=Phytohabitans aurantiacus TaxID=3016789 RepID=A0ABQ5QS58_9ACTN|nr:hemerythrin domain-containing protein [Phytohabitans aurantiacus]GLH96539.1 hypothetical protein Pa4123_18130 [Phytohabitans aurantiacus]
MEVRSHTPAGSPLLAELLRVHDWLRRDLRQCQEIARATREGAAAVRVREQVRELETSGPLWRLRANCLQYCALVHSHHRLEDDVLFPAMRRYAPELGKLVDRLERDHREVAALLDRVTTAAEALTGPRPDDVRARLAAALDRLAEHLLEHLELEEKTLAPVLIKHQLRPEDLMRR